MGIVIGIDQSYKNCAYVVLDTLELISFGMVRPPSDFDVYDKAKYVADGLVDVINTHAPSHVFVEGLAFGMTGNVTRDLAGLLFVLVTTMRSVIKNIQLLPPTMVKKHATGDGKAKKVDMINALPTNVYDSFVAAGYKKTTGLADLADAYWIAVGGTRINKLAI